MDRQNRAMDESLDNDGKLSHSQIVRTDQNTFAYTSYPHARHPIPRKDEPMPDEDESVKQAKQDRTLDFLDKVYERVVDRAKEEHLLGLRRLGNVWRLNNAEATITEDPSPAQAGDLLVTFRKGADASHSSQYKAASVDSTADAIIDRLDKLQR